MARSSVVILLDGSSADIATHMVSIGVASQLVAISLLAIQTFLHVYSLSLVASTVELVTI